MCPKRFRVRPSRLPVPASRDERLHPGVHLTGRRHRPHQRSHPRDLRPQRPADTPGVPSPPPQAPQRLGAAQRLWRPILTWPPTRPRGHAAPRRPRLQTLAPSPPSQREFCGPGAPDVADVSRFRRKLMRCWCCLVRAEACTLLFLRQSPRIA